VTYPAGVLAVSIGKETTESVPVTPTYSLPVTTCEPADNHAPGVDTSWRGAPATSFGHVLGPLDGALHLAGPVYADTIGFALAGMLGDLTTTAGTPNTHAIALLNSGLQQPPSYTLYTADAYSCLQWAAGNFADLTLSSSGSGVLTWDAHLMSLSGVPVTAPTPNFTGLAQFAGWRGAVQLGGSADIHVLSATTKLSRPVTGKRNVDGTQAPYQIRADELDVSGQMTLAMNSDTYRASYITGASTSVDITYSQGAGAGLQQVQLHCSNVTFTDVRRSYGGRWIELSLAWFADATTTDAGASGGRSPIKATLRNTVASGIYA
jgi:hypothetical protein